MAATSLFRSNRKTAGLLLITVAAAGVVSAFLPARATNVATGNAGWSAKGCFQQGSVYPTTRYNGQTSAHERNGVTLWGSYCGSDASTGELRSPVFQAPPVLELFVSGYAGNNGLDLFLEREDTKARVPLPLRRDAGDSWFKIRWWMGADTSGQPVRLVAIDHATGLFGWMGVSNPRALSVSDFARQECKVAIVTIWGYLLQWVAFLFPGFAAACLLKAKRPSAANLYLVIVVIATGAACGYLSFWAFFLSKALGKILTYTVYLSAAGLLISSKSAIKTTAKLTREPLLYALLAGLLYVSFYYLFTDPISPGIMWSGDRFFQEMRPGDNGIPLIFADRIYARQPVIPFCCGNWLSSDRPPLQSGIILLERPLGLVRNTELSYELLSSALQCFWVCGVWCLINSLGISNLRIREVLGFLIFSGFLFYNSLYTWPKLLASACILFLLSILFEVVRARRAATYFETALATVCLGLSLMAHPGSVFSLPVFGVLILRYRCLFAWRQAALAFLIVVTFYLPWSFYQKYVDPPGNRLLKMHLAGAIEVDPRTTGEALRDAYTSHSFAEVMHYKWLNVTYMLCEKMFDSYGLTAIKDWRIDHAASEDSRIVQRSFLWNAVGLANFGWLAGLYLLIRKRGQPLAISYAVWLIVAALGNLVFWSLITFGPNETQTTHSSYADLLLISVGLLGFVLTLPRIFFVLLLTWQIFNFFVVWLWSVPARIPQPLLLQVPLLVFGVALAVLLAWLTLTEKCAISPNGWVKGLN